MQNKRLLVLGAFLGIFVIGALVIMINGRPVNDVAPEDKPQVVVDVREDADENEIENKGEESVKDAPELPVVSPVEEVEAPKVAGYGMAQVATHMTPDSCWAAIGSNVYDLTTWIARHPGGKKSIESLCGTDATARFESKHGGSGAAKAALALLKIGELAQ